MIHSRAMPLRTACEALPLSAILAVAEDHRGLSSGLIRVSSTASAEDRGVPTIAGHG
jgi:hypothetical protein